MSKTKLVDLHTHTIFSDGLLTPEELFKKTQDYGLSAISIADHDTIAAYLHTDDIFNLAKKYDVELISGIELSTRDENLNKYHILGLLVDLENKELNALVNRLKEERVKETVNSCKLLNELGWKVDSSELLREPGTLTKAHVSRAVLLDENNHKRLLNEFGNKMPTEGGFVEAYLIKGKPAYIKNDKSLHPKEAIETIKKAQGVSLLAHPSFNLIQGENFEELCSKFVDWGINGFEAINVQYNKSDNDKEVQHIDKFLKYCKDNNLCISGGSDYHHSDKSKMGNFIDLGFKNYPRKVEYEVLENLKKRKSELYSIVTNWQH